MNEKDLQVELEYSQWHEKQQLHHAEFHHYEELAFIIQRFCNGQISFPVSDIMASSEHLDIQRSYDGQTGLITYKTKPSKPPPTE